jgi:hypothetical protein
MARVRGTDKKSEQRKGKRERKKEVIKWWIV